jgi:hypothetical protein
MTGSMEHLIPNQRRAQLGMLFLQEHPHVVIALLLSLLRTNQPISLQIRTLSYPTGSAFSILRPLFCPPQRRNSHYSSALA